MTIHHATKAKAEKLGFAMSEADRGDGDRITVNDSNGQPLVTGWADMKAGDVLDAAITAATLKAEYPAIRIEAFEGGWSAIWNDGEAEDVGFWEGSKPDLATILEACEAEGLDPEVLEPEEEDEGGRSIVPESYKIAYELSEVQGTCGDWLAAQLAFLTPHRGSFDFERFLDICERNGVQTNERWAHSRSNGWQGRLRMTGRNRLTKEVARNGVLWLDDETKATPPAEWVEANKPSERKRPKAKKD